MNRFYPLIILAILISFTGLFIPVFSADSSVYACIARSFVLSGNFMDIYLDGADWLDKPHFPFWLEAISMKLLGIHPAAYKLPSLVFFLIALYYTYQLAREMYDKQTGILAVLILSTAVHIFLSNNDVRAEAILLGLVTGGCYHLYLLERTGRLRHGALSAAFMAAAVMTKGPFVLIVFASALFGLFWRRNILQSVFRWKWVLTLLLTALFITPEIYALYHQFDAHPEKTVFGQQGVSGLQFFFWDSQFGRFTNSGPIKGNGHPLFYVHTILWAFAPWAFVAIAAMADRARSLFRSDRQQEYLTFFGFAILFVLFSLSKFQLAHYLNILFPFAAIMTADYISQRMTSRNRRLLLRGSLIAYALAVPVLIALIALFFWQEAPWISWVCAALSAAAAGYTIRNRKETPKLIGGSVVGILILFVFLNLALFPALLRYQAGTEAAAFVASHGDLPENIAYRPDWPFEFGAPGHAVRIHQLDDLTGHYPAGTEVIVYADPYLMDVLAKSGLDYSQVRIFDHFRTTKITWPFFYYKTRPEAVEQRYLVSVML